MYLSCILFSDGLRYAETWDLEVSSMTFVQFELVMTCTDSYTSPYTVSIEYSTDLGIHWHKV